jgi:gluconokinase
MYWTYRIPWLGEGAGHFVGLAEHVGLALLGDPSMSVSMASGTGLLGTAAMTWDEGALELAGTSPGALPPLAPEQWRGRLGGEWRRRWPSLADAAWHPAVGDGAAANLGVGCGSASRVAITVGTSAAVRTLRPAPAGSQLPALPAGLWRYRAGHDRVVNGAAYSSGGQLYAWALSLWEGAGRPVAAGGRPGAGDGAHDDQVRYDVEIPVPAGSEGVLVLPWHAGTRPPAEPVRSGQGCVLGLGLNHTGAHIVSAAVEAVCFQLAGGLDDLEAGASQQLEVLGNGGVLERSALWRSRLAGALGRPVLCSRAPETTARGAALVALEGGAGVGAPSGPGEPRSRPDRARDELVKPTEADIAALAGTRLRWLAWYEALLPNARRAGG